MKTLFGTALIIVAVTPLIAAHRKQMRLPQSEMHSQGANVGLGTSKASGSQTRTLKGNTVATRPNYDSLFANVNGVRIHYLKSGNGKTPLVLIHGFGDDARMWLPLFPTFSRDYTIIAPDLRGLGESSRPPAGYDKKTAAVDIHELVQSLGYKDIYLVGH